MLYNIKVQFSLKEGIMKRVLFSIMVALITVGLVGCTVVPGRTGYQPVYQSPVYEARYVAPEPQYYVLPNGVVYERQRHYDQRHGWVFAPLPYGAVGYQRYSVQPRPFSGQPYYDGYEGRRHHFGGQQSPQNNYRRGMSTPPQQYKPPSPPPQPASRYYAPPGTVLPRAPHQE